MNKEQTFRALIESKVREALREVYGMNTLDLTEKQALLVDKLSHSFYAIIGNNMTVKEFKELYEGSIPHTVQKD